MAPTSASHRDGAILFGVAAVLYFLLTGLATKSIYFRPQTLKRSENGLGYWSVVVFYAALLIVGICMLLSDWYHIRLPGT